MRAAGAAAAVAAALALAACGSGSGTSSRPHRTTTSTSSPPTTSVPSSTSTTPITIALVCSTPSDAAHAFVQAWQAGDRAAAGRCAAPDAVAALFARAAPSVPWAFQQCDGPDPGVPVCTYTFPGGTAQLTLMGTEAQGWKVSALRFA